MKAFVEYLVKQIVSKPDEVVIEEVKNSDYVNLKLKVSPEDMGLIIGKEGKNIRAVRSLARAKTIKAGVKVSLELVDFKVQNDQI